jgi:hypothetical protein
MQTQRPQGYGGRGRQPRAGRQRAGRWAGIRIPRHELIENEEMHVDRVQQR